MCSTPEGRALVGEYYDIGPLITACIHIAFAFPFIMRLLPLVGINDVGLFALCTLVSVVAFALIYAACYGLTARTYYRIVGSDD